MRFEKPKKKLRRKTYLTSEELRRIYSALKSPLDRAVIQVLGSMGTLISQPYQVDDKVVAELKRHLIKTPSIDQETFLDG